MKRITIFLDDQESKILDRLIKKYGGKAPAIFKEALKFRFDKAFPLYASKNERPVKSAVQLDQEMTVEEICEYHGGTVNKNHSSGPVCENIFGDKITAPLSMMGKKGLAGDYRVKK